MLGFWVAVATISIIFVLFECTLRWGLGFGRPVLYIADPEMGYRLRPNQRCRRLGRRIEINAYSLRGDAISLQCPADITRILLLGDSVGGHRRSDRGERDLHGAQLGRAHDHLGRELLHAAELDARLEPAPDRRR
ncbi:MAG: hypothetical protein F6J87_14195, partial [Spirulina sp. SIO3F2]|nr:hypothetical protein [Spirulina sp. SIO3F2]